MWYADTGKMEKHLNGREHFHICPDAAYDFSGVAWVLVRVGRFNPPTGLNADLPTGEDSTTLKLIHS